MNLDLFQEKTFEVLYEWLPSRYKTQDLVKLFSSEKDGYSMSIFLKEMRQTEASFLFLKSKEENIFGAFCPFPWKKPTEKTHIGSRETFLFSIKPKAEKFGWTAANDFFLLLEDQKFSLGGGGALAIRGDWKGSSAKSETFNNPPLNGDHSDYFEIVHIEIFGLV